MRSLNSRKSPGTYLELLHGDDRQHDQNHDDCPDCGNKVYYLEASFLCPICGYSIETVYS